jgi:hypothetical protein
MTESAPFEVVLGGLGLTDERAARAFVAEALLPALRGQWPDVEATVRPVDARAPRRVLVVANQTLGTPALDACIRARLEVGPSTFHLLAPTEPVLSSAGGDDFGDPVLYSTVATSRSEEAARDRLYATLELLHAAGIAATGEVVIQDPVDSVLAAMASRPFDEIVLSTLPVGASRWLRRDLPSRLQRAVQLPLTVVIEQSPA